MNFHLSRPVRIAIALVMATCVQQLIAMPDPDTGFKGWHGGWLTVIFLLVTVAVLRLLKKMYPN